MRSQQMAGQEWPAHLRAAEEEPTSNLFGCSIREQRQAKPGEDHALHYGHSTVVHGENVIVYGGFSETRVYQHISYTKEEFMNSGPTSGTVDASEEWNSLPMWSGTYGPTNGDVWILHLPTRAWRKVSPESCGHENVANRMATDGADIQTHANRDIQTPANRDNTAEPLPLPLPRADHSAVVWKGSMYVFGGRTDTGEEYHDLDDLWALNLETFVWRRVIPHSQPQRIAAFFSGLHATGGELPPPVPSVGPRPRYGHTAHVWGDSMFVYGGCNWSDDATSYTIYGDVWEFNFTTECWTPRPFLGHEPMMRAFHVGCTTSAGQLLICGGRNPQDEYLNDIFALDLPTAAQTTSTLEPVPCVNLRTTGLPPAARDRAAAVCHNGFFSIFSGWGNNGTINNVHQLNLRTLEWHKMKGVDMYTGRESPSVVQWRGSVIIFGGLPSWEARNDEGANDLIEVLLEPLSLSQLVSEYMRNTGLATDPAIICELPDTASAMLADGVNAMLGDRVPRMEQPSYESEERSPQPCDARYYDCAASLPVMCP